MQEDIEHRSVTLAVNTAKMTARALKSAISKYLNHRRNRNQIIPHGKQTVKQLVSQGQGVTNIEITGQNIKSFERVARKYGVDYALKKDASKTPPRYLVFFKAKDSDALTAAFKEYTDQSIRREENRPSLLGQLRKIKEQLKSSSRREKHKEMER